MSRSFVIVDVSRVNVHRDTFSIPELTTKKIAKQCNKELLVNEPIASEYAIHRISLVPALNRRDSTIYVFDGWFSNNFIWNFIRAVNLIEAEIFQI